MNCSARFCSLQTWKTSSKMLFWLHVWWYLLHLNNLFLHVLYACWLPIKEILKLSRNFLWFENFTRAYLFQIALEIMWLPVQMYWINCLRHLERYVAKYLYKSKLKKNVELPCLCYTVVLLPQKRFEKNKNGDLRILQNRLKNRFWGKRTTIYHRQGNSTFF